MKKFLRTLKLGTAMQFIPIGTVMLMGGHTLLGIVLASIGFLLLDSYINSVVHVEDILDDENTDSTDNKGN